MTREAVSLPRDELRARHDWESIPLGIPVIVRYKDHVRFENADSSRYKPWTLEIIGWLDYQDENFIRLVGERYAEPGISGNARVRSTGVSIVKSAIVELKSLAMNSELPKW